MESLFSIPIGPCAENKDEKPDFNFLLLLFVPCSASGVPQATLLTNREARTMISFRSVEPHT
jgi:hypothetical protein